LPQRTPEEAIEKAFALMEEWERGMAARGAGGPEAAAEDDGIQQDYDDEYDRVRSQLNFSETILTSIKSVLRRAGRRAV